MKTFLKITLMVSLFATALGISAKSTPSNRDQELRDQITCLARNIYFEASTESLLGREAVAWVTLNRVQSERYPDTVCDVVYQAHLDRNGNPIRNKCQFSWYCDGKADVVHDKHAYAQIYNIAANIIANYYQFRDPTGGAVMYHAYYVKPAWRRAFERTTRIDSHIFYTTK